MVNSKLTRILLVSADTTMRNLLKDAFREEGYPFSSAGSFAGGIALMRKNNFEIVIFDLKSPHKIFSKTVKEFKNINPDVLIIVIINTPSFEAIRYVLRLGIFDYIINPFKLEELLFRIKNATKFRNIISANKKMLEELGVSRARLEQHAAVLQKEGSERVRIIDKLYKDIQDTYMRTIKTLIQAIDARDHYTHSHSQNVTRYAVMIAKALNLGQKEVEEIREACALHDLGKIAIHDQILTKPGKLTKEEWVQMKLHSSKGAEILSPLGFLDGVIDLIREHHERFDGKGYPDGIKGENIPLGSRIMAVADAYDAMTSHRPYRKRPLSKAGAIAELKKYSGTQFDPKLIKVFLKILNKT